MDCRQSLTQAVDLSKRDLIDLSSQPSEQRLQMYNDMKRERAGYERECDRELSYFDRAKRLGYFDLALIKLAYTLKGDGINLKDFTEDEYAAFLKLDKYLTLDYVRKDEISSAMFNKRGKIYEIVKDWYDNQMDEYLNLIDKDLKVRQTLASALREEYEKRFEKVRDGIEDYFHKDRGAPRDLFNQYEEVVRRQYEAELERQRVEAQMRREAEDRASRLEEEVESLREQLRRVDSFLSSYGVQGRDVAEKVERMVSMLQGKVRELLDMRDRLVQEKRKMEESIKGAKDEVRSVMDAEIARYAQTQRELEEKISKLQSVISTLEAEKASLNQRIKDVVEKSQQSTAVKGEEARVMEVNFLGRLDMKVRDRKEFYDPIRGEYFSINGKDLVVQRSEEVEGIPQDKLHLFPHNTEVTYVARKKRLLRDDLEVVVKGKVIAHRDAYLKTFYDDRTVSLAEVMEYLDKAVDSASKGRVNYVVGIASPTGFDEGVRKYVDSEDLHRNFVNYYVEVVLVDLLTGEVFYNRNDDRVKSYVDLFKPELERERIEKVKDAVRREVMLSGGVAMERVMEMDSPLVVKRALKELEREGYKTVKGKQGEVVMKS